MSGRLHRHPNLAPFAVACLAIAIFSAMDAIMKGLSLALGAYNAMFWRTVAGIVLTLPLFLATLRRQPDRRTLQLHLWRGVSAAISVLLFFWGLMRTPLATGIAISFVSPLIALALAAIFLKERIGRHALAGSVVAFTGVMVVMVGRTDADNSADAMAGAIAILIAALFYSVSLVIARRQSQAAGPLEVAFFFNLVALGVYGTAAPWLAIVPAPGHLLAIVAAAISSSVSLMLLAWAYARAEAQILVTVEYTAFIWAALLGWLVFGETLSLPTLAGAAMIVAGCLWAVRTPAGSPALPLAEAEPAP
jgi:S-adenosylmethionine uptake transporter